MYRFKWCPFAFSIGCVNLNKALFQIFTLWLYLVPKRCPFIRVGQVKMCENKFWHSLDDSFPFAVSIFMFFYCLLKFCTLIAVLDWPSCRRRCWVKSSRKLCNFLIGQSTLSVEIKFHTRPMML